jgi:hypothetical protein
MRLIVASGLFFPSSGAINGAWSGMLAYPAAVRRHRGRTVAVAELCALHSIGPGRMADETLILRLLTVN